MEEQEIHIEPRGIVITNVATGGEKIK